MKWRAKRPLLTPAEIEHLAIVGSAAIFCAVALVTLLLAVGWICLHTAYCSP